MSQTSYQQDPNPAVEGMLADVSLDREIRSAIPQEDVAFGRFVSYVAGAGDEDRTPHCVLPSTAGEITGNGALGFALNDITLEGPAPGATAVGWAQDSVLRYLRSGWLWVLTEEAVSYGDDVFVRFAAGGGGSDLGRTRTDADTASAAELPGAVFRSTITAAGLALVEYRPVQ